VAYTKWLTEQTGFKYRLPTEAEWEYFARAGSDTDYWWGNEIGQGKACCDGCGAQWGWDAEKSTAPVGSFAANPFGIYDTVGNVWEWTCSEYTDKYNESKKEENCLEIIKTDGELVVLRGGAWNEKPESCRVSRRNALNPGERSPYIGFRVVRELK
jgi:formylglycine-generating enzyme required for sulfatase activity